MRIVLIVLLALFGVAVVAGGVIAFLALRKARDGFEDDHGFHPTSHRDPK